jgi:hypothetical protein
LAGLATSLIALLAMASRISPQLGRRILLASAVLLFGFALNSCAKHSPTNGTAPGTYPITLTVSSA